MLATIETQETETEAQVGGIAADRLRSIIERVDAEISQKGCTSG
ncbi:hypothetical protein NBRC3279_2687 [Acetobacter pasteurianus NBRC 3279]|uniref:Uncharacterized protein n=1 Tax=Acetobacter pasteurianus subsp. pasteurianus TaxID=481145 RepID=A0AAC9X322_ACEPA|nr:hypothetical protein S101468_03127 [Acetobacter pasteurianus subsp. pasteurianus]GCD67196.1 hypothetical protein NBRC3279_2687 [Acetobacter pasteurianus NBRC 3279]GCD73512.1 hypothetical protein NBRC3284_2668 [Acetobacter pasteurianus NBRC 3284]